MRDIFSGFSINEENLFMYLCIYAWPGVGVFTDLLRAVLVISKPVKMHL